MENRLKWLEEGDKKILIVDFTYLEPEDMLQLIDEAMKAYEGIEENSIYSLTDLSNTYITSSVYNKFKKLDAITGKCDIKSAVVGMNKAKTILLNLINMLNKNDLRGFSTREEAMNWITK